MIQYGSTPSDITRILQQEPDQPLKRSTIQEAVMTNSRKKQAENNVEEIEEAKLWLSAMHSSEGLIDNDQVVAVYVPSKEILKHQAKTKLSILFMSPMFRLSPCFVPQVRKLLKLAPNIRHVVTQRGIGTYISSSSSSSPSNNNGDSICFLDYNLVYNRIGFIRWREILRVEIVRQKSKNFCTLSFVLKEIQKTGDHSSKNVRLDWALQENEDLHLIKKRINKLLLMYRC